MYTVFIYFDSDVSINHEPGTSLINSDRKAQKTESLPSAGVCPALHVHLALYVSLEVQLQTLEKTLVFE